MNRRDFFKNVAGAVSAAALSGVVSQQAPTVSGGFAVEISNSLTQPFTVVYDDELVVYEFLTDELQVLAGGSSDAHPLHELGVIGERLFSIESCGCTDSQEVIGDDGQII